MSVTFAQGFQSVIQIKALSLYSFPAYTREIKCLGNPQSKPYQQKIHENCTGDRNLKSTNYFKYLEKTG